MATRAPASTRWSAGWRRPGSQRDVGLPAAQVLTERFAHPAPLIGARHPVAAEQLLLRFQRQARDLPAHGQPLEEQLLAALPAVVQRRGGPRVELFELPDGPRAQLVTQHEDVALGVAV